MGKPDHDNLKKIKNIWQSVRSDTLLQRVLKNSGYLFSSSSLVLGLAMLQSILAGRLLGAAELGVLGSITAFASTINRLFSFRMGELVIKYLGDYLPNNEKERAAALIKIAGITEAATSILAFIILILLAPLGARFFAKDLAYTPLFRFYGFSILGGLMSETATGVLQSTERFKHQAWINLGQSILTAAVILAAFLFKGGLWWVVSAYLVGKLILGILPVVLAWQSLDLNLGTGWWRTPITGLPPWKELLHFAVTSNLSATVNMLVRDSEILWVAFFLNPTAAGYYKVAIAISSLIPIPVTPFISATFPEISRSTAAHAWQELLRLIKRVSLLSTVITACISVFLVLFGRILILFYGAEFLPAYPALMVLLAGYAFGNLVFWNRPLLLALNLPGYPFWVTSICGSIKILLTLLIIPRFGIIGAAALLTGYLIVSGGIMAVRGLQQLRANSGMESSTA
ncbi:MAG: oligosaccharide flippase family protein [Chloroflexi bacterium]|nr:oligosaccharide flippase family protein [Chloroflexota bacterium]